MELDDLDYNIPKSLVALYPKKPRDESNLLINIPSKRIVMFKDIINELNENDALVFNDTKVLNADFEGICEGKMVAINLNKLESKRENIWSIFLKTKKKLFGGEKIHFFNICYANLKIKIINNQKTFLLKFNISVEKLKLVLKKHGKIPIPPYIKIRGHDNNDNKDYQTLFARYEGAVASPTASLHFTENLINKLKKKKIKIIKITLHVNGATFLPIKTKKILEHLMYFEDGKISKKAASEINEVRKKGGRVIAVGTTVLRLLESSKDKHGFITPFDGSTNIFIKPGYKVNTIDGLITNFHTPRSTLLLLIYSLIGKKKTDDLYNFAIKKKLRFFSYGDACLIWKTNE